MPPRGAEPYRIAIDKAVLDDLKVRLAHTRWPVAAAGPDWALGTGLPYMRRVIAHWHDRFDWRAWETRLNRFEQIRVPLGGMQVHAFIERGSGPDPIPIILTHGWPGSAIELIELAEPLAHPERFGGSAADAFTVIIPSLPGTGFTSAPAGPIGPREIGRLWGELMHDVLGFDAYLAHGGDWGACITSWMGADRAPGLQAIHLNNAMLAARWSFAADPPGEAEQAHMARMTAHLAGQTAYQIAQGTKPLTLAYGLTDSPAGLAAWILEKFHGWTIRGQDADPPFDLDHLIANLMFYWLGDTQAASWIYRYLVDGSGFILPDGVRIGVPVGLCLFPDDIALPPPDALLARAHDVVHLTRAPAGGHFPGLEHPELLVRDIRAFRAALTSPRR